jgi:PAS domain S-box-containing protein
MRQGQEARYRTLIEGLPVVAYHYTEGSPVDYLSPNVEGLLGYPAEAYVSDHQLWHRTIHPDDRERMEGEWHRGREGGIGHLVECRYVRPDGSTIWIRDHARVERDPETGVRSWHGVLIDITAQKVAEQERETSQRRYRALVEQVPAIVYEVGPDDERRTLFVSPHVERLLGYSRQEWLDQPDIWIELLYPEDREFELAALDHHNETGEPWDREYRLIASDGTVVRVSDKAVLVSDLEAGTATWHGVMLDISDRRELEERQQLMNEELELRVHERTAQLSDANEMMELEIGERGRIERELRTARERYRRLVEDLPAVVYLWDVAHERGAEPDRSYFSPHIVTLLGYSMQDWNRTGSWHAHLHPDDRARVMSLVERCKGTGEPFDAEYRCVAEDGREVWVADTATMLERAPDGLPGLFHGVMLDITGRRAAERRAQEVEARLERLIQETPGIVWVVSGRVADPFVRWQHFFVKARGADLLGYELEEFQGPSLWRTCLHPEDATRVIAENEHIWRTGAPWSSDFRMNAKDAAVIWFHVEGRAVELDADGLPSVYQGLITNIDERKRREDELSARVGSQGSLLEGMPAIPWTEEIDPSAGTGRLVYLGPQTEEILGWSPAELTRSSYEHMARFLHPDDRARVAASFARAVIEGGGWNETYRIVVRDGTVKRVRSVGRRVSPIEDLPQVWQGVTVVLEPAVEQAPPHVGETAAGVSPEG